MEEIITKKHCSKCKEWKPVSEFVHDKNRTSGLFVSCKSCYKIYYDAHREQIREQGKKYRAEHREEKVIKDREYRIAHLEERREFDRKRYPARREERREYNKKYQASHKEELRSKGKERRAKNLERDRANWKKHYIEYREEICEYAKEYRATHREEMHKRDIARRVQKTQYQRMYRIMRPDKTIEYNNTRRARKLSAEGNGITARQWRNLKEEYNHLCAYCNQKKPLAMDHIVPLSEDGRHDAENIIPACRSCNSSKGKLSLVIFLYRKNQSNAPISL